MAELGAGAETEGRLVRFVPRTAVHDRDWQEKRLEACGVDPTLFGTAAETGLFGQDCFRMMTLSGETLDGMVHLGQRFRLHRRVELGEPLHQTGWIESDEVHPRGRSIVQRFAFHGADGSLAIEADMYRLTPDTSRMGMRERSGTDASDPREGLVHLADRTMRPDDVTGFSSDVGNRIHFEPVFAARYGYRAPLAQGIQTQVWMMGLLAARGVPVALDVTARFTRPVHWDDEISLWSSSPAPGAGDVVRVTDPQGALKAEMRIAQLRR